MQNPGKHISTRTTRKPSEMSILQKKYTPSGDFIVKTPENTPEQSQ